ncbi:hotdog fold thioesterase [Epidermidibacterium keratini]|uniref:Hotdog fold thioesterase n=2 Tax=Epidermidibacterium keratini TaxID=1891644 RepID=A0A7L4YSJ9_9ACTN|nr:hotdog fold thioesterase [Epidermidibacterium keratini]
MVAGDATAREMGAVCTAIGSGAATVQMPVGSGMTNGHGTAHGGAIFTLADIAFSYACNSGGVLNVAAAADIQYVAPAHTGDVLIATATERMRYGKGDRSGLYDVPVTRQGDGALIAIFTGRSAQIGAR